MPISYSVKMAKVKTAFFCSSCGTQFSKWLGQCTACKQWNTIVEEVIQKEEKVTPFSPVTQPVESQLCFLQRRE